MDLLTLGILVPHPHSKSRARLSQSVNVAVLLAWHHQRNIYIRWSCTNWILPFMQEHLPRLNEYNRLQNNATRSHG